MNFCIDQVLRVVSINDSIMNFYISNGKERENQVFSELSSKSSESPDTFEPYSDRKSKSKWNISVHLRTSVHSEPSLPARKESQMHQILRF